MNLMNDWSQGIGILTEQDLAFLEACKKVSLMLLDISRGPGEMNKDYADNLLVINDYLQKYGVPVGLKDRLEIWCKIKENKE